MIFMKHLAVFALSVLLCDCSAVTSNTTTNTDNSTTSGGGYSISVQIINIPAGVIGHKVQIYVQQQTSPGVYYQNGQINATLYNGFSEVLKTYTSASDPGTNAMTYTGSVTLSFYISVDVNGNNAYFDWGSDLYDHVHYQNINFTQAATQVIDYSVLKVSNGS